MDQFIYVLKVTRLEMLTEGATPEEQAVVARHFEYLKGLAEQGVAILAGRTQNANEKTFGIVVLEASSEQEARARMENDPAVKGGVMRAELFPFRVAAMRQPF